MSEAVTRSVHSASTSPGLLASLDPLLREWLPRQRWFAGKGRPVAGFSLVSATEVLPPSSAPALLHLLVRAHQPLVPTQSAPTHPADCYQLLLGVREALPPRLAPALIGRPAAGPLAGLTVYEALHDPRLADILLEALRERARIGELRFERAVRQEIRGNPVPRLVTAEQSNSSIVYGDALVLKAIRRVEPGINPELELLRFLSSRGFANIAPLAGWYEYEGRLIDATLGILQEFLPDGQDGWELALDELGTSPDAFLERLAALGTVTGEMHTALGSDNHDPAFAPDEPSVEALSLLTATVDEEIERIFLELSEDDPRVAPIYGRGQDVRELLQALSSIGAGGRVIRTHGDYHLGQTMLTSRGWVILDFEGEPARPLPERRRKTYPLRDVAGMLRSFAYAASASRILRERPVADEWEDRARDVFLEGYFARVEPSLLPPGEAPTRQLLAVFELEKAVYELRSELNHRPDWVGIPAAGIARLIDADL